MLCKRSYLLHCFWTFFSPQVWPDLPNIVINSSLDWDSQVEVKGPLWILGEVRVARKVYLLISLFFLEMTQTWLVLIFILILYHPACLPCFPTCLSWSSLFFVKDSLLVPCFWFIHKKTLLACLPLPASQWSGSLPSHISVIPYTDLFLFFPLCSFFFFFALYLDIRVSTCLLSIVYKSWKFPWPSLSVAPPTLTTSIIELVNS